MTDSDWGDEGGAAAPKKRRIPTWAWWTCGGGCLLMTLAGIALTIFTLRVAREFLDPEKAWEAVREVLPHDQRPEGWEAHGVTVLGIGNYFLTPPEPNVVVVVQSFRRAADLEAMFDPESHQNRGMMLFEAIRSPEPGTLELQGREVRVLRFQGGHLGGEGSGSGGNGIRIDLGRSERPALVQISLGGAAGQEPVSAERVTQLLAPFDVWRGR